MKYRIILPLFVFVAFFEIVLVGTALAQTATPAQPSFGETLSKMMPVILASFFIFYFMVVRPQNQKTQAQQKLLKELTKGDQVMTTSGIYGKVIQVEDTIVTLEIASQVRIRIQAAHIVGKVAEQKSEAK